MSLTDKRNRKAGKNNGKGGKVWYKLQIDEQCYMGKNNENLRNRVNAKLINNKKDYSKCTSKRSDMSHKVFVKNLVAIR